MLFIEYLLFFFLSLRAKKLMERDQFEMKEFLQPRLFVPPEGERKDRNDEVRVTMNFFDAVLLLQDGLTAHPSEKRIFDLLHNQYYTYLMEGVDWQWEVEAAENNEKLQFCVISFFPQTIQDL